MKAGTFVIGAPAEIVIVTAHVPSLTRDACAGVAAVGVRVPSVARQRASAAPLRRELLRTRRLITGCAEEKAHFLRETRSWRAALESAPTPPPPRHASTPPP